MLVLPWNLFIVFLCLMNDCIDVNHRCCYYNMQLDFRHLKVKDD